MPPNAPFLHVVIPGDPVPSPRPRARITPLAKFVVLQDRIARARSMRDVMPLFRAQIYMGRASPAEIWKNRGEMALRKAHQREFGSHPIAPKGTPLEVLILCVFELPKSKHRKTEAKRPGRSWQTSKGAGDFDNLEKPITDAANEIVYHDDCQIVRATIEKVVGSQGESPRLEILIRPMTDSAVVTQFESTLVRLRAGLSSVDLTNEPTLRDDRHLAGEAQRTLL